MRSSYLPPASMYHSADRRRTRSRIDVSGLLPWGELFLAAMLLIGFSAMG
jgi:hypothetical protein